MPLCITFFTLFTFILCIVLKHELPYDTDHRLFQYFVFGRSVLCGMLVELDVPEKKI